MEGEGGATSKRSYSRQQVAARVEVVGSACTKMGLQPAEADVEVVG